MGRQLLLERRLEMKRLIVLLVLLMFFLSVNAADPYYYWNDSGGGLWCDDNPYNWDTGSLPGTDDYVFFEITGSTPYTVDLTGCTIPTIATMEINDAPLTIDLAGISLATSGEVVVGEGSSETGELAVDDTVGSGSLTVGGKLDIGHEGNGSVTITNDSDVSVGATGVVVGDEGTGHLLLTAAGSIASNGNIVAGVSGENTYGYGDIDITESGTLSTAAQLIIGDTGNASMTLSEGGSVFSDDLIAGQAASSTGNIEVVNSGIAVNDEMIVGDAGQSGVTISAGGSVSVGNNAVVGHDANSSGTVTITGYKSILDCDFRFNCRRIMVPSSWSMEGNCYIGSKGTGNLYIQDHGRATCEGSAYISYPHDSSYTYTGKGTVEVNDGSFEVASTIQVGGGNDGLQYPNHYSIGMLSIKNGGAVTAGNVLVKLPNPVSLDDGTLTVSENGNVTIEQGTYSVFQARLVGYGTVNGNIINHGLVQPGKINVGPLTVNGNYTQDGTNTTPTLLISILGNETNKFNKLDVSGTAIFGTTNGPAVKIKLDIPNGSSLEPGDYIDIVSANGGISMNSVSLECTSGWNCSSSLENSNTTLRVTFSSSGSSGSVVDLGWLVKGNSPSEPIQYFDNNGEVHAFISYSRENYHEYPCQLLDVNLTDGQTEAYPVDGPTGKVGMPLRHSNGKLYIPSMHSVEWPNYTEYHGMVAEFDPLSGQTTRQWPTSDMAVYCMVEGDDGRIYIGGGTKGYLNILDPETGVMTNFGIVDDPNCGSQGNLCQGYYRYVDSLGADDKYIYAVIKDVNTVCGTTLQWSSYLVRIDQHTFVQKVWPSDCTEQYCDNWKKCGSATSLAVKRVDSTTGTCSVFSNATWALDSTISGVVKLFYFDSAGVPQLVCSSGCDTYSSCLANNSWEIKNVLPCYKYSYDICGDHYFTDNGFKIHVTEVAPTETCDGVGNLDVAINYWPIDSSCNLGTLVTCTGDADQFLLDPMPIMGLYSDPSDTSKLFGFAFSTGPIYGPFFWIDNITSNPIDISSKGYFYRSIYDALYDSSVYGSARVFVSGYAGPTAATMVYNPSQSWTLDREDDLYTNPTGINPSPVPLTGLSKYHLHQAVGSNGLLYIGCDLNRDNPVGGDGGAVL